MKGNRNGCNMHLLMQNITKEYGTEVDALLSITDPEYKTRPHIKPHWWMNDLEDNPEKYPKLSKLGLSEQKRYLSFYLKSQGRMPSSNTKNARGWILPEVVKV
jgi:hypothetical protein